MAARRRTAERFAAAPAAAKRRVAENIPTSLETLVPLDATIEDDAHRRVARRLGKHAGLVEHVAVRVVPLRARGAAGMLSCRITAMIEGRPAVVVEQHAADAPHALRRAADELGRTLQRALRHVGRAAGARLLGPNPQHLAQPRGAIELRDDDGSLHDRRVGHAPANLARALDRPEKRRRDRPIDTAQPEVAADDRIAGYGGSAARNTRRNTAGMTAALEDSRGMPSRKSTRRSTNRTKAATPKQRTTQLAVHAPTAGATRARARDKTRRST